MSNLTIDQLIAELQRVKQLSTYGGETVVCVCIQNVPYVSINRVNLDQDEYGSVVLLHPSPGQDIE